MRLIAEKDLTYARASVRVGEEFNASASDAKLLIRIGFAHEAPTAAEEVVAGVRWTAQVESARTSEPVKRRRTYRRRDMTAEG